MTTDNSFVNPFRQFRAEQFDENLWTYYVSEPFENLLVGNKPLVIEGGRGSGKTMFFLCNSWREQRYALKPQNDSLHALLDPSRHVGLYYRVDTPFITSLQGGDLDPHTWEGVFATYLSTCLLRELVDFLIECERASIISEPQLLPAFERVAQILLPAEAPGTLHSLRALLGRTLDEIERLANNPKAVSWSRGTSPGRLLAESIAVLRTVEPFAKTRFQIFIDEYESLLDYQQRQVNSLIKHSTAKHIYNIGLRPSGMRTSLTTSDTEQIEAPHDYVRFSPEVALSPKDVDTTRLESVLRDICRKRFENARLVSGESDGRWLDIAEYLGTYSIDDELALFTTHQAGTLESLATLIKRDVSDETLQGRYLEQLGTKAPVANARLHVCLLQRVPQYRPKVEDLAAEFAAWSAGGAGSKRYDDWWHNTKVSLTFLLCHEHRRQKRYAGVDVYAMLSSGIIRYFIELCEQAFDFAHSNGFTWGSPRPLTYDEQTRAARYVSRYKVNDIERYPMGGQLRQLTMSLGTIFQALHKNRATTLGEPEVNHFAVGADELAADESGVRQLLAAATLWAILQTRPSTKDKEIERKADSVDYHMNHIYCPYFGISYRQKRKIELSVSELRQLSGGETATTRAAVRAVLAAHRVAPDENEAESRPAPQLRLLSQGN